MADKDAEEIQAILSVVSTEVPKLLNAINDSLFGSAQTGKYAEAVSEFYKSLREAGMDEDKAFELTRAFMDRSNLAGMLQDIIGKADWSEMKKGDRESEIEKKVKRKIKERLEDKDFEIDFE
jgi:flavodoxin